MPRRVRISVNKDSLLSQMAGLSIGERTSDDERSALENLPDVLFNRIVQHFHDPQDFFSLAATKYSFKSVNLYSTERCAPQPSAHPLARTTHVAHALHLSVNKIEALCQG